MFSVEHVSPAVIEEGKRGGGGEQHASCLVAITNWNFHRYWLVSIIILLAISDTLRIALPKDCYLKHCPPSTLEAKQMNSHSEAY